MKARIIKALAYPREFVHSNLRLEDCPHNGMYDDADARCLTCDDRYECGWLYDNDEFVTLEQKSVKQLVEALEFALDLVTAEASRWEHDSEHCHCEICTWMREARELLNEVQLV